MHTNENPKKSSFKFNKGLYFIDVEKYKTFSTSQLWEKSNRFKFFAWIFSFLACVIAINAILISQLIIWCVDKTSICNAFLEISKNVDVELVWRSRIIHIVISLVFQVIILWSLSNSIFKCFKSKSFKYLSFLPTMFIFIQAIYSMFDMISYAIQRLNLIDSFNISVFYILNFVMIFVYPIIWFFISRNVSLIRRIAFNIEMSEQMVNYMNQQTSGNNNPFGPSFENIQQQAKGNGEKNPEMTNNNHNTNDAFYLRMKSLTRDQLNEIAKTLSISGYDSMTDDELIKIIADIRNVQNRDKKDIEIKTEEFDKDNEEK